LLENASLASSDFTGADLRHCRLLKANLAGAILTAAKLYGIEAAPEQLNEVLADWVDFSSEGNGLVQVSGLELVEYYLRFRKGPVTDQRKRFFGQGDVLRNATLQFSEASQIEIESHFENCTITLGQKAVLTIGPNGILAGCQIIGEGEIVIHGKFYENGVSPGILGPSRLFVGKEGTVMAVVQQPVTLTQFGFEHGCSLRLRILKSQ
jgi:Pentapeptide repeats (8 copies)